MSAVEEIKEALETSMHIHGSKAMQHAEELDALRAKVAELDAEIERLRERLKSRERFAVFFETQYRENPRQTLAEFIDAWNAYATALGTK